MIDRRATSRARRGAMVGAGLLALFALAGAGVPTPADRAVQEKIQDTLSRPEFQADHSLAFLRRLVAAIERFFRWLGSLHATDPVLYWILIIVLVTLLALLIGHIAWTVRRAFFVTGMTDSGADRDRAERERRSGLLRQEAARRAEEGDYTEAIRYLFLSLVYLFDESGRVSFQRAYTNREYLALFHDRPQVEQDLKLFVDTLDQHWYGQRPTDRQRYDECLNRYMTLV